MNKNQNNVLSYMFLLIQEKLKVMNLESLKLLAHQFQLDPSKNISTLISELAQMVLLQTVQNNNSNCALPNPMSNNATFCENLQNYMFFSNYEKNYYNNLLSSQNAKANLTNSAPIQPKVQKKEIPSTVNAKAQEVQQLKFCICGMSVNPDIKNSPPTISCISPKCGASFHTACIPTISNAETFECPKCVLSSMDPFNEVICPLSDLFYLPAQHENFSYDFMFNLNQEHLKRMVDNQNIGVEIRSIRLSPKDIYEPTWIDHGEVLLNNLRLIELTPLNLCISLKKRKDENIFLRDHLSFGTNFLKVVTKKMNLEEKKQFKLSEKSQHLIGVFLVEKKKWSQVLPNVKVLNELYGKQKVMMQFQSKDVDDCNAVKLDKIIISALDTLDLKPIDLPARGVKCEHLQCFSLDNYLKLAEKSSPRRFRCPICRKPCYDLYIDEYFMKILIENRKKGKKFNEISFFKDGNYIVNETAFEEETHLEEKSDDEVFGSNDFCWNHEEVAADVTNLNKKKANDVILIEDEPEEITNNQGQYQMMQNFPSQNQSEMKIPQNLYYDINDLKAQQLQLQLYLKLQQHQHILNNQKAVFLGNQCTATPAQMGPYMGIPPTQNLTPNLQNNFLYQQMKMQEINNANTFPCNSQMMPNDRLLNTMGLYRR